MLRYISHEIRSPLMVVSSNLHFLKEDGCNISESASMARVTEAVLGCEAAITVGKK